MTRKELGSKIQEIYSLTFELKKNLRAKYSWDNNDARFTMFNKIINTLEPATISYYLLDKYLVKKSWWQENGFDLPNDEEMSRKIIQFEYNIGMGLIQNFSYCVESSLRVISRQIQPEACNNGTSEYKSIYASLLKKVNLQKHEVLFDLFRNIRNAMHNNGIYYHKNNCDQIIKYKENEYTFEIGKPCEFANTKLAIILIAEMILSLVEFVETKFISEFPLIKEEWTTSEREAFVINNK